MQNNSKILIMPLLLILQISKIIQSPEIKSKQVYFEIKVYIGWCSFDTEIKSKIGSFLESFTLHIQK